MNKPIKSAVNRDKPQVCRFVSPRAHACSAEGRARSTFARNQNAAFAAGMFD